MRTAQCGSYHTSLSGSVTTLACSHDPVPVPLARGSHQVLPPERGGPEIRAPLVTTVIALLQKALTRRTVSRRPVGICPDVELMQPVADDCLVIGFAPRNHLLKSVRNTR